MKLAASLLMAFVALAGCIREPEPAAKRENLAIAVDVDGRITLNGKQVTEEELSAYLASRSRSVVVETYVDGKSVVTVDGKTMTPAEYKSYLASMEEGKVGARP